MVVNGQACPWAYRARESRRLRCFVLKYPTVHTPEGVVYKYRKNPNLTSHAHFHLKADCGVFQIILHLKIALGIQFWNMVRASLFFVSLKFQKMASFWFCSGNFSILGFDLIFWCYLCIIFICFENVACLFVVFFLNLVYML